MNYNCDIMIDHHIIRVKDTDSGKLRILQWLTYTTLLEFPGWGGGDLQVSTSLRSEGSKGMLHTFCYY